MNSLPVICRYKSFWRGVFVGAVISSLLWIFLSLATYHARCEVVTQEAAQPRVVDDWADRVWHENNMPLGYPAR